MSRDRTAPALVVGYAGFGNLGDDLIAHAVGTALATPPRDRPLLLQTGPQPPKELFAVPGARILKRRGSLLTRELLPHLPQVAGIVYAGGSLFQGHTTRSLLSYAAPALLARLVARPRALFGQGLGPFFSRAQERLAAAAFHGSDLVVLRDRASRRLLDRLGVSARRMETAPDPVCAAFEPGRVRPRDAAAGARKILLNFRPAPACGTPFSAAEILRGIVERDGDFAYLAAFSPEDEFVQDAALAALPAPLRDRVRRISLRRPLPDLLAALAAFDAAVGERLHFHILCRMAGVPSIALAYDPKVRALFHDAGLHEFALDASPGHAARARALLAATLADRRVAAAAQLARAARDGRRAAEALDLLAATVAGWTS